MLQRQGAGSLSQHSEDSCLEAMIRLQYHVESPEIIDALSGRLVPVLSPLSLPRDSILAACNRMARQRGFSPASPKAGKGYLAKDWHRGFGRC